MLMKHCTSPLVRCVSARLSKFHRRLTFSPVRSQEDKKALAGEESFERFHPPFTYPVCLQSYYNCPSQTLFRFTEKMKKYTGTQI